MKPEIIVGDVDRVLKVNQSLMERIMADETFASYRSFTRLDDVASAIGTVKLGEKTNQWLADQIEEDEDFEKLDAGNSCNPKATPKAGLARRDRK